MDREREVATSRGERSEFIDKLQELLPDIEFDESPELAEARAAVLEVLLRQDEDPDLIRYVWTEYARVCEQIVDDQTELSPRNRAQQQLAMLVYKALIFREAGDMRRYFEELCEVEEYLYSMKLNRTADAIKNELDDLAN